MTARALLAGLALLGVGLAAGCSDTGAGDSAEEELTVFAAASLTEPFGQLVDIFEEQNPGVRVQTSFDSSATLAAQVVAGAPADVIATADRTTMRILEGEGLLDGRPVVFARNEPALVVPPGNPAGIESIDDLQDADYVVCAPAAPCGTLAAILLAEADVTAPPASREVDVKAVLTKVVLDEADAGLVYASDVVAAGDDVLEIPLPERYAETTSDPIAVVADAAHPDLAQAFVDLVLSSEGARILSEAGFDTSETSGR